MKQVDEIYFTLKRFLDRVVPGCQGPSGRHPTGQRPANGPPWELGHPHIQKVVDDLKTAGANGPPGYDPTAGLGWQRFIDDFYRGVYGDGNAKWNWPANPPHVNGCLDGKSAPNTLQPGDTIDRITFLDAAGKPADGNFAAPLGTSFPERALPPDRLAGNTTTITYEVLRPLPPSVTEGIAAPGFGQAGTGLQYYFPMKIQWLVNNGFLEEVR